MSQPQGSIDRAKVFGSSLNRVRKMVFSDASFLDDAQMEEDNREIMRLLRENSTQDKLEGLKRLIALSAPRPRRQLLCLPHARCGPAGAFCCSLHPPAKQ